MTDLALSPHAHSVPSLDSVAHATAATPPLPSALPNGFTEDEEDYTIKCICGFQEDDGSTILCETCQTWQHIECYYTSQGIRTPNEDENHYCHECEPRSLDRKSAAERQREKRESIEQIPVDLKTKKPTTSKGHKKKKATDHSTNGWSIDKHDSVLRNGASGSPRDGAPSTKRPKASHRSSNSVQTVPLKLPAQASRRSTSASHTLQSPSKLSHKNGHIEGEPYSEEFMHLYDKDPGETAMEGNSFNDITTANELSSWSHDPDAVIAATNGKSHQEIFFRCERSVDEMEKPPIQKHVKTDESREYNGRHPTWKLLTVESETPEGMIVGELRGKIGHKRDYVNDEANRWEYLRHPLPFVFFHPALPIYIDTREEGTICRYVRRSCKPSLQLKTFLEEDGSQLRFCFLACRDLLPGEELTIAWTPDEHVRHILSRFNNSRTEEMAIDSDENYVREYYAKVLSDYGGCACENPDNCLCTVLSRFQSGYKTNGKTKKGRKSNAHQSNSNGRTPSSRSGSEALRYQDDDDQEDDRSTSASSRSKPHSRDGTPPDKRSDREKRKMDAILEQIAHQEQEERKPKKPRNKRTSGGSVSTANVPASASRLNFPDRPDMKTITSEGISASMPTTPAISTGRSRYVDSSTSQRQSNSPHIHSPGYGSTSMPSNTKHSSTQISSLMPPNYVDCALQVDMDRDTPAVSPSWTKRPAMSLTKRLLKRCHSQKVEMDKKREESGSQSPALLKYSTMESPKLTDAPQSQEGDGDIVMGGSDEPMKESEPIRDLFLAKTEPSPEMSKGLGDVPMNDSPKAKIESPIISAPAIPSLIEDKSQVEEPIANCLGTSGLHVKLPSPPTVNTSQASNISTSPNIAQSPVLQTPTSATTNHIFAPPNLASLVQPSPAKKKLSLGDYMSRRSSNIHKMDANSSTDKEASPTTVSATEALSKPLAALVEEAKEHNANGSSAIAETPKAEDG